jgi:hypothetical protein
MLNHSLVQQTLTVLEIYKAFAGSINAFFLQTILLLALEMVKTRPISIWSLCVAFSTAMVGLLVVVTRLIYWDALKHHRVFPRRTIQELVGLGLEIVLALIGMLTVTSRGTNDIWTIGCNTKDERPPVNWTMICGMRVS